eukprot:757745-Hanusia_phi.AAC.6
MTAADPVNDDGGLHEQEWYKDGLKFDCTMCGNCCSGKKGSVLFSEEEAEVMAEKLNVDVKSFLKSYGRKGRSGNWEEAFFCNLWPMTPPVAASRGQDEETWLGLHIP